MSNEIFEITIFTYNHKQFVNQLLKFRKNSPRPFDAYTYYRSC